MTLNFTRKATLFSWYWLFLIGIVFPPLYIVLAAWGVFTVVRWARRSR